MKDQIRNGRTRRHPMILAITGHQHDMIHALKRIIAFSASMTDDRPDWEGRNGRWSAVQPGGRISAFYSGPSVGTCTVVIRDGAGSVSIVLPMRTDRVDDEGRAITAHAAEAASAMIERIELDEDMIPDANDPENWLLALAMLADRSDPAQPGRTLQTWMATPWSGAEASDVAGMDIVIDVHDRTLFELHAPHGVLATTNTDITDRVSIEVTPMTRIVGETMPSTDDAMAVLRAMSRAIAAGAMRHDDNDDPHQDAQKDDA